MIYFGILFCIVSPYKKSNYKYSQYWEQHNHQVLQKRWLIITCKIITISPTLCLSMTFFLKPGTKLRTSRPPLLSPQYNTRVTSSETRLISKLQSFPRERVIFLTGPSSLESDDKSRQLTFCEYLISQKPSNSVLWFLKRMHLDQSSA